MAWVFNSKKFNVAAAAAAAALLTGCAMSDILDSSGEKSAKDEKSVAAAMMRAGEASRQRGDLSAAVAFFKRAHRAEPEQIDPLIGLGEALVAAGLGKEAANAFRKALTIDQNSVRALRGLGNALIAQDQLDLAVEQFQKALAVDARDYRAYSGLGVAYDSMAKHETAQEFYYSGLEIAPDDIMLRNNLGLSLAFAGHYKAAIGVLRPLALRPSASPRDRQNLALAYGLSGDTKEAKRFARMDMDSKAVERNMNYYAALRSMTDPLLRVRSVRAGYALQPR